MIALVVLSSRLCQSATVWQWVAWFLIASFAAPFAAFVVREGRKNLRKSLLMAFAILATVTALLVSARPAAAIPYNICAGCWAVFPDWLCEAMYDCER